MGSCYDPGTRPGQVKLVESYNQLQKCWDTPPKKRPSLLQVAPGHRSVRCNTALLPPIQSCSSKFWVWSCIASNFDKGWRGDHKHKFMDRPFMPKYGTASQVLLQLVVASKPTHLSVDGRATDLFSGSSEIDGWGMSSLYILIIQIPRDHIINSNGLWIDVYTVHLVLQALSKNVEWLEVRSVTWKPI